MKKTHTLIFLLSLISCVNFAQRADSILVEPKVLGVDDIITAVDLSGENVEIMSGNRFPIAAADLPFSTFVITKEEIRKNGYETLVDALKMVPGIRVSQPGSAMEGETFLMRGLLGNTYTKILINDVPIKPSFVASMPIGAQLPIKEAERIEVIFGSGAALYGADASAGVINIVTRQSDKPVFMQADLSVGSGLYSNVSVMFGGKLGRDKNIIKYFAYGSNVLFEERQIFYDKKFNYNPLSYPGLTRGDTAFVNAPNYAGTSATNPLLTSTPHLSRRFGGYLKYRGITISAETMYRRDHSALGLNPVAVSYRDPLTYTGERILRLNLNFFKNKKNSNRKTDITFIEYSMDERSSILYVQNLTGNEFLNAATARAKQSNPDSVAFYRNQYFLDAYSTYLNGSRYRFAGSEEVRLEHIRNYRLFKIMTLTAGANAKALAGIPFTEYLSRPEEEGGDLVNIDDDGITFDSLTFPVHPQFRGLFEGNAFAQLFYNGKRFNLAGGVNQAIYATVDDELLSVTEISQASTRLSGLLKISESFNIRSSWGLSFRVPNEFYPANTYRIDSNNKNYISRPFEQLSPEKTTSLESGIRFKSGEKVSSEFTWFRNETSDLISFRALGGFNQDSTRYISTLGYRNNEGSKLRFSGGSIMLNFNFVGGVKEKSFLEGRYTYSWTNAKLTRPDTLNTIELPEGQLRMHQLRTILRPTENSTFIFDYLHAKGFGQQGNENIKNKYGTLDLTVRYAFTRRFDAYAKIVNVFDQEYPGIRATRNLDELSYNPQSGRWIRLGMNYLLD